MAVTHILRGYTWPPTDTGGLCSPYFVKDGALAIANPINKGFPAVGRADHGSLGEPKGVPGRRPGGLCRCDLPSSKFHASGASSLHVPGKSQVEGGDLRSPP